MKEPDPLDEMRAAIEDGKQATKLLAYSEDFDEPTGRTEVHVNLQSHPEIERPKSDPPSKANPMVIVLTVVRKFPAWGAVIVALAGIAAYVYLKTR